MRRTVIFTLVFLSIASFCGAQNLLPQPNKKGLWGYVNEKGKFVIKPVFQSAERFSSNLACVRINDTYGYINPLGQFIITPAFEYADSFDGKYAKCRKSGHYGYIDTSGSTVIDFEYSDISPSNNKQFLIGKKEGDQSQYIITLAASKANINRVDSVSSEMYGGYYAIYLAGKVGYIQSDGRTVIYPTYLEKLSFSRDGIAISHKESGYGLVSSSLYNILPEKYSYLKVLNNGNYIYGNSETKFGMISRTGKTIFRDNTYTWTKIIEDENYIEARKSDTITILDKEGSVIIANCDSYSVDNHILTYVVGKVPYKLNLSSGAMAVSVNGKDVWTKGKASYIVYESPFVMWKDATGLKHHMTSAGIAVFEEYTDVCRLSEGIYRVEKDGRQAVANASGKILSEWVKNVSAIDGEYIKLVMDRGYGRNFRCAIMRGSNGKMITGWDFTMIYEPLSNGLIPVELAKGDRLSRTSKLLKMMGDNFYVADSPSEGMYSITDFKTGKMGVMTEDGKILVSPKYDEVGSFCNGMCRVWNVDKGNGFIDKSGLLVIPCQYQSVLDFGQVTGASNYTQVWDNYGFTYYIDKKGRVVDSDKVLRDSYDSQKGNSWY